MNTIAHDRLPIGDLLAGCTPGRVQSVGRMQVLPLLGDAADAPTVTVPTELRIGTSGYGTLTFANPAPTVGLVPCHLALIVDRSAQDHAMPRAALVEPSGRLTFDAAMCVQQTQSGLIPEGPQSLAVLPLGLRAAASASSDADGYSRLWPAVQRFNASSGLAETGNLVLFLKHFALELERFVAEFECVPDQVGAVVLLDGELAGIERAPSPDYWSAMWEPLIRFCYGAEAIRSGSPDPAAPPPTRTALTLPTGGGDGAAAGDPYDVLAEALRAADAEEQRRAERALAERTGEVVATAREQTYAGVTVGRAEGERLVGAYAVGADRPIYASLTARSFGG
ncbi:ARPP-1 family domain-containing protein [Embleya sp. AB8]|uniref:ARPP-1 family domain-containing protein n=1 Tax=Embleya sp. AB8 TaxID=3156304 RepID=UPI003C734124